MNRFIDHYNSINNGYNKYHYDLKNVNSTGPGRPKRDRSDKVVIGFESTLPLKVRLEEEAKNRHMTISALIRDLLESHFEER